MKIKFILAPNFCQRSSIDFNVCGSLYYYRVKQLGSLESSNSCISEERNLDDAQLFEDFWSHGEVTIHLKEQKDVSGEHENTPLVPFAVKIPRSMERFSYKKRIYIGLTLE